MNSYESNLKGSVAELAIATEAAKLGIQVLAPMTEHARYDLVFAIGSHFHRIQCKWGRREGDLVIVNLAGFRYTAQGSIRSVYSADEIDAVAAYCGDLDRAFLLPIAMVAKRRSVQLRLAAAKNYQRAGLNWARDYEFAGAVAQLGERLRGTQEGVGSSPISSTPRALSPDPEADAIGFTKPKDTVGMDEFYARLAHYVRHAQAGNEVLVTRWGRPVARLVPPADPFPLRP